MGNRTMKLQISSGAQTVVKKSNKENLSHLEFTFLDLNLFLSVEAFCLKLAKCVNCEIYFNWLNFFFFLFFFSVLKMIRTVVSQLLFLLRCLGWCLTCTIHLTILLVRDIIHLRRSSSSREKEMNLSSHLGLSSERKICIAWMTSVVTPVGWLKMTLIMS